MLTFSGHRIFLITGFTDMRRAFNGLAGLARELLGATPTSRDLFLFSNRARTRLKILVFDESGTWILAKRLDKGTFAWPDSSAAETVEYRAEELALLLGGLDSAELTSRKWHRRDLIDENSSVRA